MVQQQESDGDKSSNLDEIRILLVGDPGVGKTSLISSLVNDDFQPNVPARLKDVIIPAEVTQENLPLHIIDYSEREQSYDDLRASIREANVLCIVYIAGDDDSLERVTKHWIPTVRKCQSEAGAYKPIILVANKDDLLKDERPLDRITSVLQEFLEVEAFIEVSAFSQKNVVELFSSAQKAVIYPLDPLFDPQLRVLTRKCRSALIEIFKLCDHDGDGLLSDHELNLFQENCFGTPLQKDLLDDLKSIIQQSTMDGIREDSLTQTGFLFLHILSIDNGRHDFTWQVLRKFNYDNQINAKNENSKLAEDVADLSLEGSFSNGQHENKNDQVGLSSEISDDDHDHEYDIRNYSRFELGWIREHANIIKAGLGVTLATLMAMLTVKYLVHGANRSSA